MVMKSKLLGAAFGGAAFVMVGSSVVTAARNAVGQRSMDRRCCDEGELNSSSILFDAFEPSGRATTGRRGAIICHEEQLLRKR